jgi:type II secretory pathway component PulF
MDEVLLGLFFFAFFFAIFLVSLEIFLFLKKRSRFSFQFVHALNKHLEIGTPLPIALEEIYKENNFKNNAFLEAAKEVKAGKNLYEALKNTGLLAYDLHVVRAGEKFNLLKESIDLLEKKYLLEEKILGFDRVQRRNPFYQFSIFMTFFVLIVFIEKYIMPTFFQLFQGMDIPLRAMMLFRADFLLEILSSPFFYLFLALGIIILIIFSIYTKKISWEEFSDYFLSVLAPLNIFFAFFLFVIGFPIAFFFFFFDFLFFLLGGESFFIKIPGIGGFFLWKECVVLSKSLSLALTQDFSLQQALDYSIEMSKNKTIQEALLKTKKEVQIGSPLSSALEKQKIFPPFLVWMVYLGENTGNLPIALEDISRYYEEELPIFFQKMETYFRVATMLCSGFCVFMFIFGVIQPLAIIDSQLTGWIKI